MPEPDPDTLKWMPIAETPIVVPPGRFAVLLFQQWEKDFNTKQWQLLQWLHRLYGHLDEVDTNGCTYWCLLPELPLPPEYSCGIHSDVPSHVCGKLCPPCTPCATRPRMKMDNSGGLVVANPRDDDDDPERDEADWKEAQGGH